MAAAAIAVDELATVVNVRFVARAFHNRPLRED